MRPIQLTRAHPRSPRAGAFETPVLLALHLDKFGLLVCQLVGRGHLNGLGIDLSSYLLSTGYLLSTVGGLSAGGPRAAGVFCAEDCGEPGASVCSHPTDQPHPHGA